jgi:hypothetical protein
MSESPFDYESWLLDATEPVLRREIEVGASALAGWERALYCLWVADYSMRNAGDLGSAYDLASDFKSAGLAAARTTDLRAMASLFELDDVEFARQYAGSFDEVCRELLAKQSSG